MGLHMKYGSKEHGEYVIRTVRGEPLVFARRISNSVWKIHGNPPETFLGQPYEVRELNIPIGN